MGVAAILTLLFQNNSSVSMPLLFFLLFQNNRRRPNVWKAYLLTQLLKLSQYLIAHGHVKARACTNAHAQAIRYNKPHQSLAATFSMDEKEALLYNRCASPETGEARVAHWSAGFKKAWRRDYCPCVPARYTLAIMSFLGFVVLYALRVNLSMAIVIMVNNSANGSANNVRRYYSLEMLTMQCTFIV